MIACDNGSCPIVEFLASKGADLGRLDSSGKTLLFTATVEGHIDNVRFLIKNRYNDLERYTC